MSQNKNSPLQGDGNETVSGDEECTARIGGWRPHVFRFKCFIIIMRDKQNPQTWGNLSLVLIQGAMLSLFQVALFDPENYKVLIYVCLYGLLAIGVFLFLATTTLDGATRFIFFGSLVLLIALPMLPSFLQLPEFPESEKICARLDGADLDLEKVCTEMENVRQGLSHKGVWLTEVCVGQAIVLLLSWWASTRIKSTWKAA